MASGLDGVQALRPGIVSRHLRPKPPCLWAGRMKFVNTLL